MSEEHKGETGYSSYGVDFGELLDLVKDAVEFISNAPYEAGTDFDTEGNPIRPGVHYLPDEIQNLYMEKPYIYGDYADMYGRKTFDKMEYQPSIMASYLADITPRSEKQEFNMYDYDDMLQDQYRILHGIEHGPNKLGIENYTMSDQFGGYFEDDLYWENMVMPRNPIYSPNEEGEMMVNEAWSTMPEYYHQPWSKSIKRFDPFDNAMNFTFTKFPDSTGQVRQGYTKGYDYPIYITPEGEEIWEWDLKNFDWSME